MAHRKGASALLVFPPNSLIFGSRPEMVVEHFKRVADVTDLPLVIFQYAATTPLCYSHETLQRLLAEVPTVRAIKDGCADPIRHEFTVRELQSNQRPFNVLTTHSAWLFSSLMSGCNGILSGAGSTIAALHVALFEAVKVNDLAKAKAVADRIYPMASAFYAQPLVDMHNRMKEAQVILGRLPSAVVRPPLEKLSDAEVRRIRSAIREARISGDDVLVEAA
jgi:4-hydroxy-tetrahydrodipicolinate synthase